MPSIEYGMGQASLGPCLIGTTFMISLRNCCYAAIRYEIMKVVPFLGQWEKGRAHLASGLLTGKVQFQLLMEQSSSEKAIS